ncbi:EMARD protein, partial [Polypterus senegalus]|nr:EMARD protein [Polypterus senegalus]
MPVKQRTRQQAEIRPRGEMPMNQVAADTSQECEKDRDKCTSYNACTLYCPRTVLEVVSLLRKIVSQCSKVIEQVVYSSESRYTEWMNKSLRSRQRITYIHLLHRFLKLSLQFAENLVTYTNSEKNKWSESINLIHKYFDKVELFFKAINFKEDKL